MKAFFQDKKESRIGSFSTLDYAPHLHSALEVGYMEEGESLINIEGKEYPIKKGDLFLVFPNLIHAYAQSERAKGYLAIITSEDLAPFSALLSEEVPLCPVLPQEDWEKENIRQVFALAAEEKGKWTREVRRGWCRVLAGKILPLAKTQSRVQRGKSATDEILSYLAAHSGESLSRKSIARALGLSESTVSHVFSQTFKTSLPSYLNRLRLEESVTLLEETGLSVTRIAAETGFGSLRSFNRAFQEHFGTTPTAYRKGRK